MKYDFEVDLADHNSGHTLMVALVGAGKRVLEVGCATGYMSRVFADRGCSVVGVEIDADAAERAREVCEAVHVIDVESPDFPDVVGSVAFDAIVFGDVLEHLRDPVATLRRMRSLVSPGGCVVASIPNVAHGAVRLALLDGHFDYTRLGLLDETHLRFFTRGGVERLFREGGFVIVETRRTVVGLFDTEIKLDPDAFEPAIVKRVQEDPEATTYQFVVKALPDDGLAAVGELHGREEAQRGELVLLRREVESLRAEVARLTDERTGTESAETARLADELARTHEAYGSALEAIDSHEQRWAALGRRRPVRAYRFFKRLLGA